MIKKEAENGLDQEEELVEEKLEEAHDILDKAVAILLKEAVINFEMDVNNWPIDHSNDEELLSDLGDIQMKIIELRYRFKELAVS